MFCPMTVGVQNFGIHFWPQSMIHSHSLCRVHTSAASSPGVQVLPNWQLIQTTSFKKYKAKKKTQTNPFISFLATILVYNLWLKYRISLFILIPLTLALVFDGWRKSRWNKPFSKYHLCLSAWRDSLFDFLFDFFFFYCASLDLKTLQQFDPLSSDLLMLLNCKFQPPAQGFLTSCFISLTSFDVNIFKPKQ